MGLIGGPREKGASLAGVPGSSGLEVFRRWRSLFVVVLSVSLLLGVALAFLLPARYRARAILLPPDERGIPPLTQTGRDSLRPGSLAPGPLEVLETPAGLAARLLSTRPVREAALARLEPPDGWPAGELDRMREALGRGLRAWVTDEKIVIVEVEAENPRRAAACANALGEALDAWNRTRRRELARARREALEGDIAQLEGELARMDASLPRALVLQSGLEAMGAEWGRARADEEDPRPAIEFVERALPPDRPARPIRAAVVGLVLFAGFLGWGVVVTAAEASRRRGGSGESS